MRQMCQEMRETRAAIRAGCAYTGVTQAELAGKMNIRPETFSRKMSGVPFTEYELIVADKVVKFSAFKKRKEKK